MSDVLRSDSAFWRRWVVWGTVNASDTWLRVMPVIFGLLFGLLSTRRRRSVMENLRRLMPQQAPWLLWWTSVLVFVRFAQSLSESMAAGARPERLRSLHVDGAAMLDRALDKGSGVILATAHTPGWELALAAIGRDLDRDVAVVMDQERDAAARGLHASLSRHPKLRIIPRGDGPASSLPLLAVLRHGGIVAAQLDRCPPGLRCTETTVGGLPISVPAGPFLLASVARAPVVPVVSERVGYLRYRLHIGPVVAPPPRTRPPSPGHAPAPVARAWLSFVRRHPSQWLDFSSPTASDLAHSIRPSRGARLARVARAFCKVLAWTGLAAITLDVLIGLLSRPFAPPLPAAAAVAVSTANPPRPIIKSGVRYVVLRGTPTQLGTAHTQAFSSEMYANERALWSVFDHLVPFAPLRTGILDIASLRYRHLGLHFPYARRLEIYAAARGFSRDPWRARVPTYQRFLLLNALYDVSLSFEHSPLIGCSSVVFPPTRTASHHTLLGRNFDFEAHPIFDSQKAVIVFEETGKIPVLSVAWPGLAGVVTGMNARGVALVVHGARAGHPSDQGQPVLITLREALANASTVKQAVSWISSRSAMVSHLVLVADATGRAAIIERVPGQPAFVRWRDSQVVALTNHFQGPASQDPANLRVRAKTSTVVRARRLNELVASAGREISPADVLAMLRDRRAPGGARLPAGDRRAIDACIATHGVVMDLDRRVVWVSQGPHLTGKYVPFGFYTGTPRDTTLALPDLPADPRGCPAAGRSKLHR